MGQEFVPVPAGEEQCERSSKLEIFDLFEEPLDEANLSLVMELSWNQEFVGEGHRVSLTDQLEER